MLHTSALHSLAPCSVPLCSLFHCFRNTSGTATSPAPPLSGRPSSRCATTPPPSTSASAGPPTSPACPSLPLLVISMPARPLMSRSRSRCVALACLVRVWLGVGAVVGLGALGAPPCMQPASPMALTYFPLKSSPAHWTVLFPPTHLLTHPQADTPTKISSAVKLGVAAITYAPPAGAPPGSSPGPPIPWDDRSAVMEFGAPPLPPSEVPPSKVKGSKADKAAAAAAAAAATQAAVKGEGGMGLGGRSGWVGW